jgi:hypothetical protein
MKSYDLLFKVPMTGQASPDGVRDTDEFFMRTIDALVDTLLEEKKIPHERLADGQRNTWIDHVKDVVLRQPQIVERFF